MAIIKQNFAVVDVYRSYCCGRALKQLSPRLAPLAEALCILLHVAPELRLSSDGGAVTSAPDYWRPLRRQLGDTEFLKHLGDFDRMGVTLHTIKRLQVASPASHRLRFR
jgi:hypothetical protein